MHRHHLDTLDSNWSLDRSPIWSSRVKVACVAAFALIRSRMTTTTPTEMATEIHPSSVSSTRLLTSTREAKGGGFENYMQLWCSHYWLLQLLARERDRQSVFCFAKRLTRSCNSANRVAQACRLYATIASPTSCLFCAPMHTGAPLGRSYE